MKRSAVSHSDCDVAAEVQVTLLLPMRPRAVGFKRRPHQVVPSQAHAVALGTGAMGFLPLDPKAASNEMAMNVNVAPTAQTTSRAVSSPTGDRLPRSGAGSEQQWAEVYDKHASAVLSLARNWLCNTALAEEVVQDVFVRLWTRSECFDPTRGSLRSYLLTQTRWRCVDLIRSEESRRTRECRAVSATELHVAPDHEAHQAAADRDEALDGLRSALVRLPLEERLPIDLAYFGGLTYKEVAEVLEWPEGTVKSRIRRGLHKMRHGVDLQGMIAF